MADNRPFDQERISLCEALDRVLNTGVVVVGEVVISLADVDLIYLAASLTLTSVETANGLELTLSARAQDDSLRESA